MKSARSSFWYRDKQWKWNPSFETFCLIGIICTNFASRQSHDFCLFDTEIRCLTSWQELQVLWQHWRKREVKVGISSRGNKLRKRVSVAIIQVSLFDVFRIFPFQTLSPLSSLPQVVTRDLALIKNYLHENQEKQHKRFPSCSFATPRKRRKRGEWPNQSRDPNSSPFPTLANEVLYFNWTPVQTCVLVPKEVHLISVCLSPFIKLTKLKRILIRFHSFPKLSSKKLLVE